MKQEGFGRSLAVWIDGWLAGDPMRSDGRRRLLRERSNFAAHLNKVFVRQDRLRAIDVAMQHLRVFDDVFAAITNGNDVVKRREFGC